MNRNSIVTEENPKKETKGETPDPQSEQSAGDAAKKETPKPVSRGRSSRADAGVPIEELFSADEIIQDDDEDDEGGGDEADDTASPIEELVEAAAEIEVKPPMEWYILKVQVNRENSICEALMRNIKRSGMDGWFGDILVPTEDVREFNKNGKSRVVKRKLYPGYIVVQMSVNDETWFLVRDTPGIGDFTGSAGKPVPLGHEEISKILAAARPEETEEDGDESIKTAIKFKVADRVRVKDGYFQNYEGDVSNIDERNGRVTVMINIFGRANPVELDHWQVESM